MTVQELITELQRQFPDMPVFIEQIKDDYDRGYDYMPLTNVSINEIVAHGNTSDASGVLAVCLNFNNP